jgi:UDP-N-acetyl-alpha-D-muramoyl-L-alanyl-L-glutamate epimerase
MTALTTPLPAATSLTAPRARATLFTYGPLEIDETDGVLRCSYELDGRPFTEIITLGPGLTWSSSAREAARLVGLLAGVSYYKAGAPRTIDLARTPLHPGEREFLKSYYLGGLGEFAYVNNVDLTDLEIVGGVQQPATSDHDAGSGSRPLIPFGGGIDSIVTTDLVAANRSGSALFIVNRAGIPFHTIEAAAQVTGLPVLRAEREVDPQLISISRSGTVFNGHVPITAVISAIAVLVALLHGRDEVIMSNEWSASRGNLEVGGHVVNHQYSKSAVYERAFRSVLAGSIGSAVDWFSMLRPFSELWVARRFARLTRFHPVVHSCNEAFYLDPAQRLERWCGHCDKCCFIDLILSPFTPAPALAAIFDGREPLANPTLLPKFRLLLGLGEGLKPFECVGDVDECRSATILAAERPDRVSTTLLTELINEMGSDAARAKASTHRLFLPLGNHDIPADLLAAALA